MRLLLVLAALAFFSSCHCGPGTACTVDADCTDLGAGARCSSAGYCLVPASTGGGGAYTGGGGATGGGSASGGGTGGGGDNTDGGAPALTWDPASLDFGDVTCGRSMTREVTLRNPGGSTVHFTASLRGTGFTVSPTEGSLAPGDGLALQVTFQTTERRGAVTATVLLTSDAPDAPTGTIPVRALPSAAVLEVDAPTLSFGLRSAPGAVTRAVTLRNTGSAPLTVTPELSSTAQFDVDTSPLTLAAGATTTLDVTYRATTAGTFSSRLSFTSGAAYCGELPNVLVNGALTTGPVELSSLDVFYGEGGRVRCGTVPDARGVTLRNTGTAPWTWSSSLGASPARFTVDQPSGTLAPGASVTLNVASTGVPAVADTALEGLSDVLLITTDAPNDTSHPVTLHQSAHGAVLRFAPPTYDFGATPVNARVEGTEALRNLGSLAVPVSLASDGGVFTLEPDALLAAPGDTLFALAYAPTRVADLDDGGIGDEAQVAALADAGLLCAPLPAPLRLRGNGSAETWSVSPTALDFGRVNCGATALPQSVRVTNGSDAGMHFDAALAETDGRFSVTLVPASGDVGPGEALVVTVTPATLDAGAALTTDGMGGTLRITPDRQPARARTVALHQTAQGARLSLSRSMLGFPATGVGATATSVFALTNAGNTPATLSLSGVTAPFRVPTDVVVPANGALQLSANFAPTAPGSFSGSGTFSAATGVVLCGALPAGISLDGTATQDTAALTLSDSSLTFGSPQGFVACGQQASPRTFTITNTSGAATNMTVEVTLQKGAASAYTLGNGGTFQLGNGARRTVTVTPLRIPATGADLGFNAYADVVQVHGTVNAIDETRQVQLNQSAQGARLQFTVSSVHASNALLVPNDPAPFAVYNSGNVDVPSFTLALERSGGNGSMGFDTQPATAPAGGTSSQGQVSCSWGANWNGALVVTGAGTTALCAPLPSIPASCN